MNETAYAIDRVRDVETRLMRAELRDAKLTDDGLVLTGYAAKFGELSEDLGGFREVIDPGAFDAHLATGPDVRALMNHDTNFVLGRTTNNTLTLETDNAGLRMTVQLADTSWGKDLAATVERGDVNQMSFGFRTIRDAWQKIDGTDVRTLLEVELLEVSVVTFPAYPQTEVAKRTLATRRGARAQLRRERTAGTTTTRSKNTTGGTNNMNTALNFDTVTERAMRYGRGALTDSQQQVATAAIVSIDEYRAQGVATDAAGAYMVSEQVAAKVEAARANAYSPVRSVATILQTESGAPMTYAGVDDRATVPVVQTENTEVTVADVLATGAAFGAFAYSSLTLISNQLMQDAAVDIEALFARLAVERIERGLNAALTTGDGSGKPTGVVTAASDSSVTPSAGSGVTVANLSDIRASLPTGYLGRASWMMSTATLGTIEQIASLPAYVLTYDVGGRPRLLGRPVTLNEDMAAPSNGNKAILFGDFSRYVIRDVRRPAWLRQGEKYADYGQVGLLLFSRHDGQLVDGGAGAIVFAQFGA